MQTDLALQKLTEAREIVDGDTAEMIDSLARVLLLQQDIRDPMYGAKVTLHESPDGEWVEIDEDELPLPKEEFNDRRDELDNEWRWRCNKRTGEYLDSKDDDETWYEITKYMAYEETEVDNENLPECFDPNADLDEELRKADELESQWMIYDTGYVRHYIKQELVEPDGLIKIKGIVYDPSVADAPDGDYWDPDKQEYRTPSEYPMGTVNLIVPEKDDEEFGDDYVSGVKEMTSVVPADGDPGPYEYTPGWPE